MIVFAKSVIRKLLIAARVYPWVAISTRRSFLKQVGRFRSVREGLAVDALGHPIPWFSYPAISFLDQRLKRDMNVFEYGSGYSTLWLADRVSEVTSCEYDRRWYEKIKGTTPANVQLHYIDFVPSGMYCQFVSRYENTFDIAINDARDRVECAKRSISALKPDGVIVWDDADNPDMSEGYGYLLSRGFKRLDFHGMGPIKAGPKCTSIFYRDDNCLGL